MMVYRLKMQPQLLAGSQQSLPLGDPNDDTEDQW